MDGPLGVNPRRHHQHAALAVLQDGDRLDRARRVPSVERDGEADDRRHHDDPLLKLLWKLGELRVLSRRGVLLRVYAISFASLSNSCL